tara:strand:- start:168 stop:635 length:468 start_codon:yes stop_codon:yes gene_type:complete
MMINIEVGNSYTISNRFKKSYVEIETFKESDSNNMVELETGWRSGTWVVTPMNGYEADIIVQAMSEGFDDEVCISDLESAEFEESWDGCWDDYDFSAVTSKTEEDLEELKENIEEEGSGWLYDNGWESIIAKCIFQGQITVEEYNGINNVNTHSN